MARRHRAKTGRGGLLSKVGNLIGGVVNRAVDLLPVELHIPGYQFCGPGTHLEQRLRRGDRGINPLDSACREHDIAYARSSDTTERAKADKILAEKAWSRVTAADSGLTERAAALAVTNIMKTKAKFGGGKRKSVRRGRVVKKKKRRCLSLRKKGKGLYLRPYKTGAGKKRTARGGGGKRRRRN
jgi:hypothetical protein